MNEPLNYWMPERVESSASGEPICRWMFTEGVRFLHPFFDETISACRVLPASQRSFKVVSALSFLPMAAAAVDAAEPAAFIFHISRCGSTLFTQLLGLDESNLVLPEVPLFDQILRLANASDEEFLAAMRLTGQKRFGTEKRLIVKTDCWHLFFAERLRKLFPNVPFILLYRKPEPVLRSHARRRGTHMIPGLISPELFGLTVRPEEAAQLDRYAAAVLEKYYRKMISLAATDPHSLLVSYDAGITDEIIRAARWAGLPINETLESKMRERSRFHSKEPNAVFNGDEKVGLDGVSLLTLEELWRELEGRRAV